MPTRARPDGASRCAYREGRQRCTKNGTGNPPLCRPHRLVLEQAAAPPREPPRSHLGAVISDVLRGKKIDPARAAAAAGELGMFAAHIYFGSRAAAPGVNAPPPRPPPRPPPPPPPPPRDRTLDFARRVLGFPPGEKLSRERIKERKRQLSRQAHPDLGGSEVRMKEINQAADVLMAELETG